ncbi:MAG: ion transporter [Bacteroidota bacterium]
MKNFDKLLLVLSLYVVVELYLGTVIDYTPAIMEFTFWADLVICAVFLYDFFRGLSQADNKWLFFRYHWIDFISSIPMVGVLRVGRLVKVFRILRVIRSAKIVFQFFSAKDSFNSLRNLVVLSVVIIFLFTLSIYHSEHLINPKISTIGDALWWTTITTISVGFLQDVSPISVEGKFISVVLLLLGMVIFSTLIGAITDFFIEDEDINANVQGLSGQLEEMEHKIEELNKKLDLVNNKLDSKL